MRAGVPVVDEDRVLARLEDRAVARFRVPERLLGARALELRRRARGEDLQQRLRELAVGHRAAIERGDQAELHPGGVVQRVRGVAVEAEGLEHRPRPELGLHTLPDEPELAPDHARAGGLREVVFERTQGPPVEPGGERPHARAAFVGEHADHHRVDAERLGERARELLEHPFATRDRQRDRRLVQGLGETLALGDVDRDAADGVRPAVGTEQREFVREQRAPLAPDDVRLLDLDRAAGLDHAPVVRAQPRCDLGRRDVGGRPAHDLALRQADVLLERAVDEQVPAVEILGEHAHGGAVVQDLAQRDLGLAQRREIQLELRAVGHGGKCTARTEGSGAVLPGGYH